VGNSDTGGELPDDWVSEIPSLLHEMRFPKHRRPTNISNGEPIICYAVKKGQVFALQSRKPGLDTIRLKPPTGPIGSATYRYPNEMDVVTHAYISDLRDAPMLADVQPNFMKLHGKKFWNGSHWEISLSEYEPLKQSILASSAVVTNSDPAI
jgi:hypothetical protein